MLSRIAEGLGTDEYATFERHVEAWKVITVAELDATQIVYPQLALAYQVGDALKSRLAGINLFHGKPGSKSTSMNGKDQYSQERQVRLPIGAIHKHLAPVRREGARTFLRHYSNARNAD